MYSVILLGMGGPRNGAITLYCDCWNWSDAELTKVKLNRNFFLPCISVRTLFESRLHPFTL